MVQMKSSRVAYWPVGAPAREMGCAVQAQECQSRLHHHAQVRRLLRLH